MSFARIAPAVIVMSDMKGPQITLRVWESEPEVLRLASAPSVMAAGRSVPRANMRRRW